MVLSSILAKEADVVIIGGGLIGCAAAYNLAKRRVKIALVEKGSISGEGSGTTFGAVRTVCRDPAEMPLALKSMGMWKNLSAALNCEVGFWQGGCLYIREKEEELEPLEQAVEMSRQGGVLDCRMLGSNEIKKLMPLMELPMAGALYSEGSGVAEPLVPARCYADAARRLGAQIYTETLCVGIEASGGRVSGVMTNKGEIKTHTVVNAAGVHAHRVARLVGFHMPLKVVNSLWGETESLGRVLFKPYFRGNRMTARSTVRGTIIFGGPRKKPADHALGLDAFNDFRIWLPLLLTFRQGIKLRLELSHLKREFVRVFGISFESRSKATFPTFVPKANIKSGENNFQVLLELLPSLKTVKIAKIWSGLVGLTPDMLPLIGELDNPKGFVMAAGWSGHGYALGPAVGELLSELIVDGKTSLSISAFRPSRFTEGKLGMPFSFYTGSTRHTL